jgi:triosephosphate isomerase (TIM)
LKRPLIINFKNYREASAASTLKLAKAAQKVAERSKVEIIVAPPQPALALVARSVSVPVFCQHLDSEKDGSTTGYFVPEIAKSYGAVGSLINHSEHRIEVKSIAVLVERMRKLGMTSVVCARTPHEVMEMSVFGPDYVAIEPPELIGSGKAVSKENPAIISKSIEAAGSRTKVICGAGITDKDDVRAAIKLGSRGILVASGVVKAESWAAKIAELASGMK